MHTGPAKTIGDIAVAMGVLPEQVVQALIGDPAVDRPLRTTLADRAHEMGYVPLAAPRERLERPLRLALVLKTFRGDDPDANRFFAPISSAIAIACSKVGACVDHIMASVDSRYRLLDVPPALSLGGFDGAFVFGCQLDANAIESIGRTCPVVLVEGYADGDGLHSAMTDHAAGARAIVESLAAAGHRDIALLGTEPACYPSVLERRRGYAEAVAALGLAEHYIDMSYVLTRSCAVMGMDYVRRHPEVTAVFGANDLVAAAFMQQARDAGWRLPSDLSVAGFDDIDLASLVMPSLTTVGIDKVHMARVAFTLMAYALECPEARPITSRLTPYVVERESVGAPRPR
jgi:LacI family transcriptional regulator